MTAEARRQLDDVFWGSAMKETTVLGGLFRSWILLLARFLYGLIHEPGESVWGYFTELQKWKGGVEVTLYSLALRVGLPSSQLFFLNPWHNGMLEEISSQCRINFPFSWESFCHGHNNCMVKSPGNVFCNWSHLKAFQEDCNKKQGKFLSSFPITFISWRQAELFSQKWDKME